MYRRFYQGVALPVLRDSAGTGGRWRELEATYLPEPRAPNPSGAEPWTRSPPGSDSSSLSKSRNGVYL